MDKTLYWKEMSSRMLISQNIKVLLNMDNVLNNVTKDFIKIIKNIYVNHASILVNIVQKVFQWIAAHNAMTVNTYTWTPMEKK